ncbi:uracil-DNA glycosylase [Pelagibacterales bacterium SAG-MED34]|nr:uracil-DNA glycosylase [Pelagibacterales bacterium SAG-MED34]
MTLNLKNQNDILNLENLNSNEIEYIFNDKPINRLKIKPQLEDKKKLLLELKNEIENIDNCELKNNATQLVFADGNSESKIMIIGEGPGQKEDEQGKPFVGDAGVLLNKMLEAIQIKRNNIYITNVVNYRPPNNRKPEPSEINRYSNFLRKHISIIDPKILILMGSTAMESLFGSKIKISKERGVWKDLIIHNKTYLTMITFHPAYLLRQAEQKKYSWTDLKQIRKKIDELRISA